VFVDGCFWHACPRCARSLPTSHHKFWKTKLAGNRLRDRCVRRRLNVLGIATLRIWEHQVSSLKWVDRLVQRLKDRDPGANT
jgi:DNA mismatch endonuclease (patch repair protein)